MTHADATAPRYAGVFLCDQCRDEVPRSVWLVNQLSRLCRDHTHAVTGLDVHAAVVLPDQLPAADAAWTRLVPGLRMRHLEGGPGVELQGVRNIALERGTETVSDAPAWTLNDEALVNLVLMSSAHRDDAAPNRALVRMALLRILHGTEKP